MPWQRGSKQLRELVWKDENEPAALDRSTIAFDRTMLADFRRRAYSPGNMVLSVIGNFPSDQLIVALRTDFGKIPASGYAMATDLR